MTSLIVDASVAVKWHVLQGGSDEARSLEKTGVLIAPELILAEIIDALWKYVRAEQLSAELALGMIARSPHPFSSLFPLHGLQARAFKLGCTLNHAIHDCFYLALARQETGPLVTVDKHLAAAGKLAGAEIRLIAS